MNINEVKRIIEDQVKHKGYVLEERQSVSTGSWYFKIYAQPGVSLLFRVSDHKTAKDVITLRLDHKINKDVVKKFVDNRCKDLSYRNLKHVLGI